MTSTPLPYRPGSWKMVRVTWDPADLSSSRYSPRRGMISRWSEQAMPWIRPAASPAAFTTHRLVSAPRPVVTVQPSPRRSRASTGSRQRTSAPLARAFSARAAVSSKGQTIPPEEASRAPATAWVRWGSRARASSSISGQS